MYILPILVRESKTTLDKNMGLAKYKWVLKIGCMQKGPLWINE